jgi:CRISPR-associated protein Cpf1
MTLGGFMKIYTELENLYSINKTLRFSLIPIGKTRENIKNDRILESDEKRAINYQKTKTICDMYHKKFIDLCLKNVNLPSLDNYFGLYKKCKTNKENIVKLRNIQKDYRKKISNTFTNNEIYKGLDHHNMFDEFLPDFCKNSQEDLDVISEFKRFTTYFTGFNINRKNMYVEDEKSTSIAYRLINENLSIFLDNIITYQEVSSIIDFNDNLGELVTYLMVPNLKDIFTPNYFNYSLTQTGIDSYNLILGGLTCDDGKKIKGLNEIINLYNQQNGTHLPKFKILKKQILSEKETISFVLDKIENDKELFNNIDDYYKINNINFTNILDLIKNIDNYDLNKIYVKSMAINQISHNIFGEWNKIKLSLSNVYDITYSGKTKNNTKKYYDEKEKYFKGKKYYSISEIQNAINLYLNTSNNEIINYYKKEKSFNNESLDIKNNLEQCYIKYQQLNRNNTNLISDNNSILVIKNLMDAMKEIQEFIASLIITDDTLENDEGFYSELLNSYEDINLINNLYDKVRNYLTRKPYSIDKIKINFEHDTLLNGWSSSDEGQYQYSGLILRKNDNYYLAIINKNASNYFKVNSYKNGDYYEKMEYKTLLKASMNLPRLTMSKIGIEKYHPSEEILKIYNNKEYILGENFNLDSCHKLINFYKECIEKTPKWKKFNFVFSKTSDYKNINEFFEEVNKQGYKILLSKVSSEEINRLVENNQIYLFQIYSKDFSPYVSKSGHLNMHTLYWKMVFDELNIQNPIYKLDGGAEIFYRPISISKNDRVIHEKNIPINKRTDSKTKSIFSHDIIKNKRFTEEKFLFHVPIVLNPTGLGLNNINTKVNQLIKKNSNNYILGIDRGERNLIYVSLIDDTGKMVENFQYSLNEITTSKNQKVNYLSLIEKRKQDNLNAKQNWQTIENIKEIKEGYLSQAIHQIMTIVEKYNAIIVMEDLNSGFKNSRIKVEKQVYQKFEKMLIDKLNYLVFKDRDREVDGGLLKAYQLANKFQSFREMKYQSGILFYIPAWNTSKIDPVTGYTDLLKFKFINKEKSKEIVEKIDAIKYDNNNKMYEFDIDYNNYFVSDIDSRSKWQIFSNSTRIKSYKENEIWKTKEINLTEEFTNLFNKYNVNLNNIKNSILSIDDAKFYSEFIELLSLTMQLRNSDDNNDYIISPVKDSKGRFYDSRTGISNLPKDADANGAYNIARKGLIIVNRIKQLGDDENLKYSITNAEWLNYVQSMDK